MDRKLRKEEKKLSKKFVEHLDRKYPNDDDIISDNESEDFINKYASKELKDYYKNKGDNAKKGIIID